MESTAAASSFNGTGCLRAAALLLSPAGIGTQSRRLHAFGSSHRKDIRIMGVLGTRRYGGWVGTEVTPSLSCLESACTNRNSRRRTQDRVDARIETPSDSDACFFKQTCHQQQHFCYSDGCGTAIYNRVSFTSSSGIADAHRCAAIVHRCCAAGCLVPFLPG